MIKQSQYMRLEVSLSHFLLGQISLGVYRENNMFNETISPDIFRD